MTSEILELGMRVGVLFESTIDNFKSFSTGTVEKSVSPQHYPFTLRRMDGAVEPIYCKYLNQWTQTGYQKQEVVRNPER